MAHRRCNTNMYTRLLLFYHLWVSITTILVFPTTCHALLHNDFTWKHKNPFYIFLFYLPECHATVKYNNNWIGNYFNYNEFHPQNVYLDIKRVDAQAGWGIDNHLKESKKRLSGCWCKHLGNQPSGAKLKFSYISIIHSLIRWISIGI